MYNDFGGRDAVSVANFLDSVITIEEWNDRRQLYTKKTSLRDALETVEFERDFHGRHGFDLSGFTIWF